MRHILLLFLCLHTGFCLAQHPEFKQKYLVPERYRMIGLNTTPLLIQLIPFNHSNPHVAGPFTITFDRFNGVRSFHTALGFHANIDGIEEDDQNIHFNFRMGTTRRRPLGGRWTYFGGVDIHFSAGGLNLVKTDSDDNSTFVACGPRWGIGYAIDERLLVRTEAVALFGIDFEQGFPIIDFIPPVAVYLSFILPRPPR